MFEGYSPVLQTLFATLMTWGMTGLGAASVIFLRGNQQKTLDSALGFAAGIMLAASFWSLLDVAIEMAETSGDYGAEGQYAVLPVAGGFLVGAFFVYAADVIISRYGAPSTSDMIIGLNKNRNLKLDSKKPTTDIVLPSASIDVTDEAPPTHHESTAMTLARWKRVLLLVVAITVHNIPEGLAIGVTFGAIGTTPSATLESARSLAIGLGIQNFPEGMAVGLPLYAAGFSMSKSIFYGQLSGMVEPIFGVIGAAAVTLITKLLPYALSFGGGAMIYVTINDILPEATANGNGKLATWGAMFGFLLMMCLDVALG